MQPRTARALTLAIVITLMTAIAPSGAWGAAAAEPAWNASGTRWEVTSSLPAEEVERFNELWTTRFLDEIGLQAYLESPGLHDDGFNALSEDEKAALVVGLIRHWQDTLPGFASDLWTGDAEADQKAFQELAVMLYVTIFAKDELQAQLDELQTPAADLVGPPAHVDAGIPEYPGMSQQDIVDYFDALHDQDTVLPTPPPVPEVELPAALQAPELIEFAAPLAPGELVDIAAGAYEAYATRAPAPVQPELVTLDPVARFRVDPAAPSPLDPELPDVPTVEGLLEGLVPDVTVVPQLPEPNELLNVVAGGTYLACGGVGTSVQCAPAPVPLGVPVTLDLDGDVLTGVGGMDTTVVLTPMANPTYLSGFSAMLRVDRTVLSASPLWAPLPAQVYVVYTPPGVATQVLAGFDARDSTLANTQQVQVTLKDIASAVAGDVQILGEITREGPGATVALLAGFAKVDLTAFPALVSDPTRMSIHFDPAPTSFVADLRFTDMGTGATTISGSLVSSLSPTVTTEIYMERGDERRLLQGVIESMPTEVAFTIVSEAVGAVQLDYDANAYFPRFELKDHLIFDVDEPAKVSTLYAEVTGIPDSISFHLGRPFDVTYTASDRVATATIVMTQQDADGIVQSIAASVEGIPSMWSISGDDSPLDLTYTANGNIDSIVASLYDRERDLQAYALVEDIPDGLTLSVQEDLVQFAASQPIGLIEAQLQIGDVAPLWYGGEFASLNADGAGGFAAAARVLGFTALDLDQRTTDHVIADVTIAGGEPFLFVVSTPEAYAYALLSNLPTDIHLDLGPSSFVYDLAQPITQITAHAELGDLAADVIVDGIPDQLSVSWTSTSLVYDANTAISRVRAWVEKGAMAAFADVQGIPADWSASWPSGTASFSTPTAVTSVLLQAQVNNGVIYNIAGDSVTLSKSGSAIGAQLRLSGIRALSADPRNGGSYSLSLSPGGQAFNVYALVDGLTARAYVSNLPQTISVDLAPNSNSFSYQASTGVSHVWALMDAASGPMFAFAELMGLPARVDLDWSTGTAPTIVYDASGGVTSIYGFFRAANNAVYEAGINNLPPYLRVAATASDIVVDARTAATAASGSGTVGSITARYGSDGTFLSGSGNHAYLYQTASITRASLGYSGLKYIRVGQAADNLVVDVLNSAPRLFTAYADTPEAFLSLTIDSIPAHVKVTSSGTSFTYDAFGSTVNEISAYFWDRESLTMQASVRGIPGQITVDTDLPGSSITYTATSPISAIDIDVWNGAWYGMLRIAGIPASWSIGFGSGTYGFDAGASSIGSIRAAITNHGGWSSFGTNHVIARYVHGGNIDSSVLMTSVQKAVYTRSGTQNTLDLRMGGGTVFNVLASATLSSGEQALLSGSLNPLPSSIQATFGEKTTVTTSQTFDLNMYGHFGTAAALAATPTPGLVHGVIVRDGASGSARGLKGRVFLTGLPTGVNIDPRNTTFGITGWKPTVSSLVLDAELDNFVSPAVDAYVQQLGIPNPQSISFNMDSSDIGGGSKRVKVDIVQTAGMGSLYADLVYGGQHGNVQVSNIPDDIHLTYTNANGQTTVQWDASAPINSVFAGFRVVAQSASFQGYVDLDQLPSDFTLVLGRASGGQGPTMSYTASASTLDVTAFVNANLFGGDLKARLSFGLVNLGASTNVFVSGTGVRFTSSPATGSVYANVWATYNYYREDSGTWDAGGFLEYPWAYHLGVQPTINNLAVTLTSFSDFSLAWGVTSKISGSYGSFSFSWSSVTVSLHAYGKVQIVVDWPWPFSSSTINVVNLHYHPPNFNVDVYFQKYTNHQGSWFGISGSPCDWSLSTTLRPHPHGGSWNGVSTSAATAEGGAWYITPNPWGALPTWGIDLVARYTSPDGGSGPGLSFNYDCF